MRHARFLVFALSALGLCSCQPPANSQVLPTTAISHYGSFEVRFVDGEKMVLSAISSDATGLVGSINYTSKDPKLIFQGWYLGDKRWDFSSDIVTENITLKAKFVENK